MTGPDPHRKDRRTFLRDGTALALSAAASPALLSGCASTAHFPAPDGHAATTVNAGDAWSYDELNGYNSRRVAQLRFVAEHGGPPALRVSVEGDPLSGLRNGQLETYDSAWVVTRDGTYDRDNRYDPPLPLLPERLEPGARESWQSMVTYDEGERALRWHVRIDAIAGERIEVPAGSFDALRVRRLIQFEHPDFFRSHSERTETLWYAPEVKRWVKREWRGSYRQKLDSRSPVMREDWIVWVLTDFTAA
jgi:hypothetical protein